MCSVDSSLTDINEYDQVVGHLIEKNLLIQRNNKYVINRM